MTSTTPREAAGSSRRSSCSVPALAKPSGRAESRPVMNGESLWMKMCVVSKPF
jgi:hypothetical protein